MACKGGPNCCMNTGVDNIAETLAVLSNLEETTKREKVLAKHKRYNMSHKGYVRYKRYEWKRNREALAKRILSKHIQIALLQNELDEILVKERGLNG